METGRSSSVYSAYSSVRSMPRTSPTQLTISLTTRPHPPRRFTSRRKAVSVMPAIGASANGGVRSIAPIFMDGRRGSVAAAAGCLVYPELFVVRLLQLVVLPDDQRLPTEPAEEPPHLGLLAGAVHFLGDEVADALERLRRRGCHLLELVDLE